MIRVIDCSNRLFSQELRTMSRTIVLFALLYLISPSFGLRPSKGCDKPMAEWPFPGHHGTFSVTYEDKLLGPVDRDYILQVPWCKLDLQ